MTIIRANGAPYDSKSASRFADYHYRCAWKSESGIKGVNAEDQSWEFGHKSGK